MARRKRWSYSAGERPHTVIVEEREPGGVLRVRAWDATKREGKGDWIRRSLHHSDKEKAKTYAKKQHIKLKEGVADLKDGKLTLGMVFSMYLEFKTPRKKSLSEQKLDFRRVELWKRIPGSIGTPTRSA